MATRDHQHYVPGPCYSAHTFLFPMPHPGTFTFIPFLIQCSSCSEHRTRGAWQPETNTHSASLLSHFNTPTLSSHHSRSKHIFLYNIIYLPPHIFTYKSKPSYSFHSFDSLTLSVPFSKTNSSSNSLIPSVTSNLWNCFVSLVIGTHHFHSVNLS